MLRPIAPGDTQAVAALWCAGWRIGHADIVPEGLFKFRNEAQFHDRIMDSLDDCFVSGADGQITGFIRLKGDELDQFYVAPDQIGKGTAQALMAAAEQMLRSRGVARAFLSQQRRQITLLAGASGFTKTCPRRGAHLLNGFFCWKPAPHMHPRLKPCSLIAAQRFMFMKGCR